MSAGSGPRTSWPRAFSVATAGAMIVASSPPSTPSSPACGLSPRDGEARRDDREIALERGEDDLAGLDDRLGRDRARHRRQAACEWSAARRAADRSPASSPRAARRSAPARNSVWPGYSNPACISTALLIGAVTIAAALAVARHRNRRFDRFDDAAAFAADGFARVRVARAPWLR